MFKNWADIVDKEVATNVVNKDKYGGPVSRRGPCVRPAGLLSNM